MLLLRKIIFSIFHKSVCFSPKISDYVHTLTFSWRLNLSFSYLKSCSHVIK